MLYVVLRHLRLGAQSRQLTRKCIALGAPGVAVGVGCSARSGVVALNPLRLPDDTGDHDHRVAIAASVSGPASPRTEKLDSPRHVRSNERCPKPRHAPESQLSPQLAPEPEPTPRHRRCAHGTLHGTHTSRWITITPQPGQKPALSLSDGLRTSSSLTSRPENVSTRYDKPYARASSTRSFNSTYPASSSSSHPGHLVIRGITGEA